MGLEKRLFVGAAIFAAMDFYANDFL